MCLIHILCRDQNMLQVAETPRLWITSQQLNEHMTKRNKIKIPASYNSAFVTQTKPSKTAFHFAQTGILWPVNTMTVGCRYVHVRQANLPNCSKLQGSFHLYQQNGCPPYQLN